MLQFLSFSLFSGIIVVSVMAIAATIKAEASHILRALGIDPTPPPARHPAGERRFRIIRQPEPAVRMMFRAAA